MQEHSAYIIGPDDHITQRIDLLCVDDADAHQQATVLVTGDTMELWQRDGSVVTFVPAGVQPCTELNFQSDNPASWTT
jgi:hypothetical protein